MYQFRECRLKAGLSQKSVALSLHVKAPSVSDWENGNTCPTLENLIKLADLYRVSTDELLGRKETTLHEEMPLGYAKEEEDIMNAYREADEQRKSIVCDILHVSFHQKDNMAL